MTASAKLNNKLSVTLDADFVDLFQHAQPSEDTLPDKVDVDMLIEAAARGCSKLTKDQLDVAQVVLSDIVGPIDDALQSTKGWFVAPEVKEHAAKIKEVLIAATAQAGSV